MTAEIFFGRMSLLIPAALLAWLFYGPWQRLMVDIARQSIFDIRDALFLMAADGELDFNSSEYRQAREVFNASLRFTHVITFRRIVAGMLFLVPEQKPSITIAGVLHRISNVDVRHSIERKWHRSTRILALTVLLRSPTMMALLAITFPLVIITYMLEPRRVSAVDLSIKRSIEQDIELQPCLALG
jgi:hypothetical protein